MRQANSQIEIRTGGAGLHDVTCEIARWVTETGIATGLLTVFVQHTLASLLVQENAAPLRLRPPAARCSAKRMGYGVNFRRVCPGAGTNAPGVGFWRMVLSKAPERRDAGGRGQVPRLRDDVDLKG